MIRRSVLVGALVCVSSLFLNLPSASAQSSLKTDLPLEYLVKSSSPSKGKPLVIFLHGYGSTASDLFELKSELPSDFTVISAQAPTKQGSGYEWFPVKVVGKDFDIDMKAVDQSTNLIRDFVTKAAAKFETAPAKTVLIGFSQGGVMAFEVGLRNPNSVSAVVALGSRMTPSLIKYLKSQKKMDQPKVFIGHGTADRTLLMSEAVEARKAIDGTSIKVEFHAYPGLAHGISSEELKDVRKFVETAVR